MIRPAIMLFTLVSLVLVMIRVISALQPPPAFAEIFTNPNGSPCEMPCMFGIRPFKTSPDAAIQLLQSHPVTQHMKIDEINSSQPIRFFSSRWYVVLHRSADNKTVENLELDTCYCEEMVNQASSPLEKTPLGVIFSVLGTPDYVTWGRDLHSDSKFIFMAQQLQIHITRQAYCHCQFYVRDFLQPTDPFIYMLVGEKFDPTATPNSRWLGLTSMAWYSVEMYK